MPLHIAQGRPRAAPAGRRLKEAAAGRPVAFQGLYQLPGVQGVHEVDVPRLAVEYLQGQLALHKDAGGLGCGCSRISVPVQSWKVILLYLER